MLINDHLLEAYAKEFILLKMTNYGVKLDQYISQRSYYLRRLRDDNLPKQEKKAMSQNLSSAAKIVKVAKTLTFEDSGQDFLEWDLDENNVVIACRPFQGRFWRGCVIVDCALNHGPVISTHGVIRELKHRVIKISIHESREEI